MFEQTFKNIDDILHKDAGCTSELDYTEQSSWLLAGQQFAAQHPVCFSCCPSPARTRGVAGNTCSHGYASFL